MADSERTEDLNPRSEDIDEKVRRMLDPSYPEEGDKPAEKSTKSAKNPESVKKKIEVSEHVEADAPASAPELPDDTAKPKSEATDKKSKKIIIPIDHHEEDAGKESTNTDTTKSEADLEEASTAPELEKIESEIAETANAIPEEVVQETAEDQPEPVPQESEVTLPETDELADPATDRAVEDIVSAEGDVLLEVDDAIRDTDQPSDEPKQPGRLSTWFKNLFHSKSARKAFAIVALITLVVIAAVPTTRYLILNTAGVRVSSSVVVLDESTGLPLKNVQTTLGSVSTKTNDEGVAVFEKMRLGPTHLKIEKLAFADVDLDVTLGLGSNPLGEHKLTPTGEQYEFKIIDYLSGKPIAKAEANSGESSAFSDDQGNIKLTVPQAEDDKLTVNVSARDYRTEKLTFDAEDQKPKELKLVPSRKHVFISKRTGKYDLYSVYIDGKNEKLLLAGSGHERPDMVLLPHPSMNKVAYVSTRIDKRNDDGYLLSTLLIINVDTGETTSVIASEKIQLLGWSGDRLVFIKTIGADSAADPKRSQLLSHSLGDNSTKELATSNYFNDALMAQGQVYFAPSSAYAGGTPAQFYRVNADGIGQQSLLNRETWSIIRTSYEVMNLSVSKSWYEYTIGNTQANVIDEAPTSQRSRAYLDSPDGKNSLWVDQRDGKGVLLKYELSSKKDSSLAERRGLTYPLSWLNNHTIVYRIDDDNGTADYALSLNGGEPVKIRDVTHIDTVDNWYYY